MSRWLQVLELGLILNSATWPTSCKNYLSPQKSQKKVCGVWIILCQLKILNPFMSVENWCKQRNIFDALPPGWSHLKRWYFLQVDTSWHWAAFCRCPAAWYCHSKHIAFTASGIFSHNSNFQRSLALIWGSRTQNRMTNAFGGYVT